MRSSAIPTTLFLSGKSLVARAAVHSGIELNPTIRCVVVLPAQ
jgi:hypothetical protein